MPRPVPALTEIAAGRDLPPVDDVDALLASASEHRMLGLLHTAPGSEALPREARSLIARNHLAARVWSRTLWKEIERCSEILGDAGISFGVFKGVTTEGRWYEEEGTRPCADVDIFVSPDDIGRFGETVGLLQPDHELVDSIQAMVDAGAVQGVDLVCPSGVLVDLHTDPVKLGIPLRDYDEMWARCVTMESPDGVVVKVLDPETALVQSVLHLLKDRFSFLLGFADVARIVGGGMDWDQVDDIVNRQGLAVYFYEALRVVDEWLDLGLPIPPTSRLRAALWRKLWPPRSRLQGHIGMSRMVRTRYWIPFGLRGRRGEALHWWLRVIFPPRKLVPFMHPDTSGPYLWRLVSFRTRLAWERHRRNAEQRKRGETFRRGIRD